MSWNKTYRPTTVSNLHLTQVRTHLQQLLDSSKLPQVFLFAGPKGTGKTSTARILGTILNDPDNKELIEYTFFNRGTASKLPFISQQRTESFFEKIYQGSSYIVQEMDAASNRGIDDIRQLKERVQLPPQEGLMTVFILDEAHMLTNEAYNALLKVLEEPPRHVVFILATTELHKVPDTIISRSHVLQFTKASTYEICQALEKILVAEGVTFDKEALVAIAEQADGSFRDAVKMAEFVAQTGAVTVEHVAAILKTDNSQAVEQLILAITSKNQAEVLTIFESLRSTGVPEQIFHKQLLTYLHTALHQIYQIKSGKPIAAEAVVRFLLQELSQPALSETTSIPFLLLELKCLSLIERSLKKQTTSTSGPSKITSPAIKSTSQDVKKKPEIVTAPITNSEITEVSVATSNKGTAHELFPRWHEFVSVVASKNMTLSALLRSAKPAVTNDMTLSIQVDYPFHQEQLTQTKNFTLFAEASQELVGVAINFTFICTPIVQIDINGTDQPTDIFMEQAEQAFL